MKCNILYVVVLGLLSIAWFSEFNLPAQQVTAPKVPLLTLPIVTDISSLGMNLKGSRMAGDCNIEEINGGIFDTTTQVINKASLLKITGWAFDRDQSRLPLSLAVRFTAVDKKDYFAPAQIGSPRPDVLSHFSLEKKLLYSGFQSQSSLQIIPEGEYRVTLVMNFKDSVYTCDNSRILFIQ